jgi:hypothetical protein
MGPTIAVQLPNGDIWAFEPIELKRVASPETPPLSVRQHGNNRRAERVEQYVLLASTALIWLLTVVLVMAGVGLY